MARREHTHSAGFNVSSLKKLSGIYFFYNAKFEFLYCGTCKDESSHNKNWKRRLNAHYTYKGKKLTDDVKYMDVLIPKQKITDKQLLLMEHFFIWYLRPARNFESGKHTHWRYFYWDYSYEKVQSVSQGDFKFEIQDSIKDLLITFKTIRIKREYKGNGDFQTHEIVNQSAVPQFNECNAACNNKKSCSCFSCLTIKKHRKIFKIH